MNTNKVYKIRRKSDGLFSKGGNYVWFSKEGKTWSSLRNLKLHLSQFADNYTHYSQNKFGDKLLREYRDCEIVCFNIVEDNNPKTVEQFCKEEWSK